VNHILFHGLIDKLLFRLLRPFQIKTTVQTDLSKRSSYLIYKKSSHGWCKLFQYLLINTDLVLTIDIGSEPSPANFQLGLYVRAGRLDNDILRIYVYISISLFGNNYKQTSNHATENKPH